MHSFAWFNIRDSIHNCEKPSIVLLLHLRTKVLKCFVRITAYFITLHLFLKNLWNVQNLADKVGKVVGAGVCKEEAPVKCKRHSGLLYITWDIILLYYHISCEQLMLIVTLRTCVRLFQSRISDFYFKLLDLQEHYTVGRAVNTLLNTNPSDHEAKFFFSSYKVYHLKYSFPKFETFSVKIDDCTSS